MSGRGDKLRFATGFGYHADIRGGELLTLSRGSGRRALDPRLRHPQLRRPRSAARHRIPGRDGASGAIRVPRHPDGPADARGPCHRRDHALASGGQGLHRQAGRAGEDLRRPGGARDRERSTVQRNQGSARAADGDQRNPAGDLELADRRAAGARGHRRPRRPAVRCIGGVDVPDGRRCPSPAGIEGTDAGPRAQRRRGAHHPSRCPAAPCWSSERSRYPTSSRPVPTTR